MNAVRVHFCRFFVSGLIASFAAIATEAAPTTRVVPTMYPTIQSAVNAASAGDKIVVLAGIYVEQVSIAKNLEITGAKAESTIIRAPANLVPGNTGTNAIVEIFGGARVTISRLTVSGPAAGACDDATKLRAGIGVRDGAHLDLSFAAVTRIHNTPFAACFHAGHGITVGEPTGTTGTATIEHSDISDYSGAGIIVFGDGSSANISHNVITGAGLSTVAATSGIEIVLGATGTISHNDISGNACGSPDLGCGPDYLNQFQTAGILAGGSGTVVSHNDVHGNQVGIYTFDGAQLSHNKLANNQFFGLQIDSGLVTSSHDDVSGGFGGVWVVAAFGNTAAILDKIRISGTSGAPIQTFECCGFTATVTKH